MDILISVVVPVYNTEARLSDCVNSLVAQTVFRNMEVILVDDGSTDGSEDICRAYAARYPNITAIRQNNAGVSAARNVGLVRASGYYVGFVDADDTVAPDLFETLTQLSETTRAHLSFCGFIECLPGAERVVVYPFSCERVLEAEEIYTHILPYMLEFDDFNTCCAKLFRKDRIESAQLRFRAGTTHGEDRLFTAEYLLSCETVAYCPRALYQYRLSPSGSVRRPRTTYADEAADEYLQDFALFTKGGFSETEIREKAGRRLLRRAIGDFWTANEVLRGRERVHALRRFAENEVIRQQAVLQKGCAKKHFSRYERTMLRLLAKRSVGGMRAVTAAVKLKTKLYSEFSRFAQHSENDEGNKNA